MEKIINEALSRNKERFKKREEKEGEWWNEECENKKRR